MKTKEHYGKKRSQKDCSFPRVIEGQKKENIKVKF